MGLGHWLLYSQLVGDKSVQWRTTCISIRGRGAALAVPQDNRLKLVPLRGFDDLLFAERGHVVRRAIARGMNRLSPAPLVEAEFCLKRQTLDTAHKLRCAHGESSQTH